MTSQLTTLYLVRHAKAADRFEFSGRDRDRPLTDKGRDQAAWLAGALADQDLAVVAASPWLRCQQTADAVAEAAGLEVAVDPRLGYDQPDVAGWVADTLAAAVDGGGRVAVAVGHGDLLPDFLHGAGLLHGLPGFRTGSAFKVELDRGRLAEATYLDRADLRELAEQR
jgi:8-oxo-dGTP diphosphatase